MEKKGKNQLRWEREKTLQAFLAEYKAREAEGEGEGEEDGDGHHHHPKHQAHATHTTKDTAGGYSAIELARVLMPRESTNLSFVEFDPFLSLGPLALVAGGLGGGGGGGAEGKAGCPPCGAAAAPAAGIWNAGNMVFLGSSEKGRIEGLRQLAEMPGGGGGGCAGEGQGQGQGGDGTTAAGGGGEGGRRRRRRRIPSKACLALKRKTSPGCSCPII